MALFLDHDNLQSGLLELVSFSGGRGHLLSISTALSGLSKVRLQPTVHTWGSWYYVSVFLHLSLTRLLAFRAA